MATIYYPRWRVPDAGVFAWGEVITTVAGRHEELPYALAVASATVRLAAGHHLRIAPLDTQLTNGPSGSIDLFRETVLPNDFAITTATIRADAAPTVVLATLVVGCYLEPDDGSAPAVWPV